MPGASGDRAGVRRPHRARATGDAWQDLPGDTRRPRRFRGRSRSVCGDAIPFAGNRAGERSRSAGGYRDIGRWRDHGRAPSHLRRGRRAIPSGSDPDRTRQATARQFPGGEEMNMTLVPVAMVLFLIVMPAKAGALEECQIAGDHAVVMKCLVDADAQAQASLRNAEGIAGTRAREIDNATGRPGAKAALAQTLRTFADYRTKQWH